MSDITGMVDRLNRIAVRPMRGNIAGSAAGAA